LPFLNDFPLTLAILSLDRLLWLEDALDNHAFVSLEERLSLDLLGCRLSGGGFLELGKRLGFLILGGAATVRLATSLVLLLLDPLDGACEPLLSGLGRWLLPWRR